MRDKRNLSHIRRLICVALGVSAFGCATSPPRQARVLTNRQVDITSIRKLTLLPLISRVDIEPDRSNRLSEEVHKRVGVHLANKGYVLAKSLRFSGSAEHSSSSLYEAPPEVLFDLGPADARYIVLPYLRDIGRTNILIMQSTDVLVSAVLIDKQERRILWEDQAKGSFSTSIFSTTAIGVALIDEDYPAISNAIARLFDTFPGK